MVKAIIKKSPSQTENKLYELLGMERDPKSKQVTRIKWAEFLINLRMRLIHNHGCLYDSDLCLMKELLNIEEEDVHTILLAFREMMLQKFKEAFDFFMKTFN